MHLYNPGSIPLSRSALKMCHLCVIRETNKPTNKHMDVGEIKSLYLFVQSFPRFPLIWIVQLPVHCSLCHCLVSSWPEEGAGSHLLPL